MTETHTSVEQWAFLNGSELYFEQAAGHQAIGKPTLVYLHGGPGYHSASFQQLMGESLSWLPHDIIYLDQRGCGRSAPLEESEQGEQLNLDLLSEDLESLRQHLGLQQIIPIGHGFGALIALEYARRFPQHTERVIVINPWVHFPELALKLLGEASTIRGQELHDPATEVYESTPEGQYPAVGSARIAAAFELLGARDLLNAVQFKSPQSRMHMEFIDAELQLPTRAEVAEALVAAGLWEFEYPAFLEEIRRPIFVLAGEHDRSSYPEQSDWVVDFGGGELSILDAGHYPWLDNEEDFVKALAQALSR